MAVKIALRSATQCATELRLETLVASEVFNHCHPTTEDIAYPCNEILWMKRHESRNQWITASKSTDYCVNGYLKSS